MLIVLGGQISVEVLAQDESYVIANKPDIRELKPFDLTNIFSMRTRVWPDGTQVRVFILSKSSPIHQKFIMENLGMMPFQLHRYWQSLVFSGTGKAPTEVDSIQEMIEQVTKTPGAIGYVDEINYSLLKEKSFVKGIVR